MKETTMRGSGELLIVTGGDAYMRKHELIRRGIENVCQ